MNQQPELTTTLPVEPGPGVVAGRLFAFAAVAFVMGCGSGSGPDLFVQPASQPSVAPVDLSKIGKLQFAVGTANIGVTSSTQFIGLNTVVTFRNASGQSAFATDTPQIVGPPNFRVPAAPDAGTDAGTNSIDGTPPAATTKTTFGTNGRATAYGFVPDNVSTTSDIYALPFYASTLTGGSGAGTYIPVTFDGVAPAFPVTAYPHPNPGFVSIAAAAVSGTYQLNVTVRAPAGSHQAPYVYKAAASLNRGRVLPPFPQPTFILNTENGGGSLSVVLPAGVTQALVNVQNMLFGKIFTFLFTSSGTQVVPGGLVGPGSLIQITAVGFDYDALGAAPPLNTQQTPKILGPASQDDITVSVPFYTVPDPA